MRFTQLLLLLVVAPYTSAEVVLVDHVSDSTNWDGLPLMEQSFTPAVPQGLGSAATFTGNGGKLKTVSGVFGHESASGVIDGGQPTNLSFRILFFSTLDKYVADPLLTSPGTGDARHTLASVSNPADWLTPIGEAELGHELFLWSFDIESLGIETVNGQTHLLSILPETTFVTGPTLLAFSNGTSATELTEDWYSSPTFAPDELTDLSAPYAYAAYRVTAIPEPGGCLYLVLAVILWRVRANART